MSATAVSTLASTGIVTAPQTPASLSPVRSNSNGSQPASVTTTTSITNQTPNLPVPLSSTAAPVNPSVAPTSVTSKNCVPTSADDLDFAADLNFDPTPIEGQGPNQDDLDVSVLFKFGHVL